ncbi:hypothetical protein BD311DRAFT_721135 [Dichomitus squalens]|uniref:F-box domain-containing protein n=1 Tax=Dichomitus squalens TaxID=114155 RepID=A0A4Q9MSL5_9APHY|nr:hypothetical protein BD311DRAFT_721135 [Dichomitus squalens]
MQMAPHQNTKAVLNLDVLYHIMSSATMPTIAAMMRVSHALYRDGAKVILPRGVCLDDSKTVSSFVQFMMAEDGIRRHYLHKLEIFFNKLSSQDAHLLAQAIRSVPDLRSLKIVYAEWVLKHQRLLETFIGLEGLESIDLRSCGEHACRFLRESRSRFVSATIHFPEAEECSIPVELPDLTWKPILLLENSMSTLEVLHCSAWEADDGIEVYEGYVYPHVRELVMDDIWFPVTSAYVYSYPNLTCLRTETIHHQISDDETTSEAQRASNLAYQLRHGSWTKLQEIHAPFIDVYLLGLTCCVPFLDVMDVGGSDISVRLSEVLSYLQPTRLVLSTKDNLLRTRDGIAQVFRSQGASKLKELELTMASFCLGSDGAVVRDALDDLFVALGSLRLTSFKLTWDSDADHRRIGVLLKPGYHSDHKERAEIQREESADGEKQLPSSRVSVTPLEIFLLHVDVNELVAQIHRALPTLQTIEVAVRNVPRRNNGVITFSPAEMFDKYAALEHGLRTTEYTDTAEASGRQ